MPGPVLLLWLAPVALAAQAPATPMTAKVPAPIALALLSSTVLPMKSASAVAPRGDGSFLVVDDDQGVILVRRKEARPWATAELHPALGDLEGLCIDEAGQAFVVAEGGGALLSLGDVHADQPHVRELGHLPKPADDEPADHPGRKKAGKKKGKNKGYEGLAALPARLAPDGRAGLVAVHEALPRHVVVLDADPLAVRLDLPLPADVAALADDLADVAVDPVTGHLLLLSDESRRVVEVKLERDALRLVGSVDLPVEDGEKPEGIAFLSDSRLVVVTDATNRLLTFAVKR